MIFNENLYNDVKRWCVLIILFYLFASSVSALRDPSAVYCSALGYTYRVETGPDGDVGYCVLPDGKSVDSWQFLRGNVSLEYSYCKQQGYVAKSITSSDCLPYITDQCTMCVLSDGREVEVTALMNLSFAESICGDGTCGMPENFISCPKDCPSGSFDEYCDRQSDGRCDPDCLVAEDVDCQSVIQNVTTVSPTTKSPVDPFIPLAAIVVILYLGNRQYQGK